MILLFGLYTKSIWLFVAFNVILSVPVCAVYQSISGAFSVTSVSITHVLTVFVVNNEFPLVSL
ncbi:hypothetical protein IKN40_04360 [bacterium]|nr:hypothetical protein [bacterium]